MEINNMVETNQVKNLTFGEKFKYFFINPNKIFEDYNTKPTWLIKLLVIIALSIVFAFITKSITSGAQTDLLMQQTPDMTKEEAEAVMQLMNSPVMTAITVAVTVITVIGGMFLTPLIYWGLISVFGGKTTYMKIVAVYTLAYIPYYLGSLLSLGYSYYTNNFDNLLNANLTDALFKRFDIFVIWQVLLLVFGFVKIANIKLGKSAIIVTIMWLLATGITVVPLLITKLV